MEPLASSISSAVYRRYLQTWFLQSAFEWLFSHLASYFCLKLNFFNIAQYCFYIKNKECVILISKTDKLLKASAKLQFFSTFRINSAPLSHTLPPRILLWGLLFLLLIVTVQHHPTKILTVLSWHLFASFALPGWKNNFWFAAVVAFPAHV